MEFVVIFFEYFMYKYSTNILQIFLYSIGKSFWISRVLLKLRIPFTKLEYSYLLTQVAMVTIEMNVARDSVLY